MTTEMGTAGARPGSDRVLLLCAVAAALVTTSSLVGILTNDGGDPHAVTSIHGQVVRLYGGHGLYRHDSVGKATAFLGFDWANLFVCLPSLAIGAHLFRRGRLRGRVILAAVFSYLGYIYLIGVMGNAWNGLFLLWTALYSTGLFGAALTIAGVDATALQDRLAATFPRKILATYMMALAILLLAIYLTQAAGSLVTGRPPELLETYTTLELAALELGIMIPLHVLGAVLLWRQSGWGYLIGIPLAFAAAITFIALTVGQVLRYSPFGSGGLGGIVQPLAFAVVASAVALVALRRVD